jgi:hypothetical protein
MNWLLCLITGYLRRNESKKVGPGTIKGGGNRGQVYPAGEAGILSRS